MMENNGEKALVGGELVRRHTHKTKLVSGRHSVLQELRRLHRNSKSLSICALYDGLEETSERMADVHAEVLGRSRAGTHRGIRVLTVINRPEEVPMVEALTSRGFEIRHTTSFPALSFTVAEDDSGASIIVGFWNSLIVSNEPATVDHFRTLFEALWATAVDASRRMEEVVKGLQTANVEVIWSPSECRSRMWSLVEDAEEVLVLFSSPNALRRQAEEATVERIREIIEKRSQTRRMSLRLMVPGDTETQLAVEQERQRAGGDLSQIEVRIVDPSLTTGLTMLIIDREHTFILETKDDSADSFEESLGVTTYIRSSSIAESYAAIYESLWKQVGLLEKLQAQEKMQNEFVKVAAHELRTPVQSILSYAELLDEDPRTHGMPTERILANVKRLRRLVNAMVDSVSIDKRDFKVNRKKFDLVGLVRKIVEDFSSYAENGQANAKIVCDFGQGVGHGRIMVYADEARISEVITNLLHNAMEFAEEKGTVTVTTEYLPEGPTAVVNVKDTGSGIDPDVLPILFSKFVTKSKSGTAGLGLYLSKNIVEAHGGTIWGRNNHDGKGAVFGFSLPGATVA